MKQVTVTASPGPTAAGGANVSATGDPAASAFAASGGALPRLSRNERGQLVMQRDGCEPLVGVRLARCFPWSRREGYLSIRDAEGNEVLLLETLLHLPAALRELIDAELAAQEFQPRITAVYKVEEQFGITTWTVQTDRGPVELQVKHAEDIRQLEGGRVLLRDHAGGLFEIPDLATLDPHSRKLVEARLA
jgi:hypothetical protein